MALPFAIDLEDLDRPAETPGEVSVAPRYCKITLAADAPAPIILAWNPGKGGSGVRSRVVLNPGNSINEILWKAEVWLGPFTVPERFENATDEKQRDEIRKFWRTEKKRVLDRYDYPRIGGKDGNMQITGPHRLPDVTVTIIDSEGVEGEPIRLHQLYKIGEFDSVTYDVPESPEAVRAEYEAVIAAKDAQANEQMAAMNAQIAKLTGQLNGFISGLQAKDAVRPTSAAGAPRGS